MKADVREQSRQDYLAQADVAANLRAYQGRQMLLHIVGPLISLALHLVLLSVMSVALVREPARDPGVEVSIATRAPKEIPDPPLPPKRDVAPSPGPPGPEAPELPLAPLPGPTDSLNSEPGEDLPDMDLDGDGDPIDWPMGPTVLAWELPGVLERRTEKKRGSAVRKYGGGQRGQDAVRRALHWLKKQQRPDGSWRSHPAHTGLALLTFLAHGETPLSAEFGETVRKGMEWLAELMLARRDLGYKGYGHGIATYALAEAYGMAKIPKLRRAMATGLQTIIDGQRDEGGFGYNFARQGAWDLSVAGWQFQAMKAGLVAGADNPGLVAAMRRGAWFCKKTAYREGKFGYRTAGSGGNMTGVGVVSLQLMGEPDCREVKAACDTILKERLAQYEQVKKKPELFEEYAGKYLYGWYYDTQAMFNRGDKYWRKWRRTFETVLVRAQRIEGYWPKVGDQAPDPILATTWSCLQLEVFYRYLPTFDLEKMLSPHSRANLLADDGDDDDDDDNGGLIIQ